MITLARIIFLISLGFGLTFGILYDSTSNKHFEGKKKNKYMKYALISWVVCYLIYALLIIF
jgi:uncharacterized membrane protein YdjX (TVP38/TMEM64 family)